ncbi:hypothetical protein Prudu_015423, partial [Prunus dulcis]
ERSSNQLASLPPFFCGSPPSRASYPVIQDEQFGNSSKMAPFFSSTAIFILLRLRWRREMVLGYVGGWDSSEKKSRMERWALCFVDWICGGVKR